MMSLKREINLAKLITLIIIILTLFEIKSHASEREIAYSFMKHNPRLRSQNAYIYAGLVIKAGNKFNVNANLIASVIICESNVNYLAVSKTQDYGLMQIHFSAHKKKIPEKSNLFDPKFNIFLGTEILSGYIKSEGNISRALKRYSGGSKKYPRKVLKVFKSFKEAN